MPKNTGDWKIVDLPPQKATAGEWRIVELPPEPKPANRFAKHAAQPNIFDRFDEPTKAANIFDQFDSEPIPQQADPSSWTFEKPESPAKDMGGWTFEPAPADVPERGVVAGIVSDVRHMLGYEQTPQEIAQRAKAKDALDEQTGVNGWGGTLMSKDGARLLAQGVTLGAADEIEAGVRALGSETYGEALESVRGDLAAARERPGSLALEMGAGALVPGGVAVRGLTQAPSLARSVWGASWRGGALGGTAGFMGADGADKESAALGDHLSSRANSAAIGAGLGAGVGAVLPTAGVIARKAGDIAKARLGIGDDEAARKALADALSTEAKITGRTTDDVLRELESAELPLALSGNESIRQLAHRSAEASPVARRQLVDLVAETEGGAGRRVERALDDAMGHEAAADTQALLQEARRANASRAYADLFEQNSVHDMSRVVDVERPTMRAAVGRANRWLADQGGLAINDPTAMTPRQIDYVARALDDSVDRAFRSGSGEHGARLSDQRDSFLRAANRQVPGYRETRAMYREDSDAIRALELGRAANLKDNAKTEALVRALDNMEPWERRQARVGALQTLRDQVRNTPEAPNVIRSVADSPARAENLREIVTPRFDEMAPELGDETRRALEALPDTFTREARAVQGAQQLRQNFPDADGGLRAALTGVDPASLALSPKSSFLRAVARVLSDDMNPRRAENAVELLRSPDWQRSIAVARAQLAQRGITIGDLTTRANAGFAAAYGGMAGYRPAQ